MFIVLPYCRGITRFGLSLRCVNSVEEHREEKIDYVVSEMLRVTGVGLNCSAKAVPGHKLLVV